MSENSKNKVITIPIEGSMRPRHSKKLEWALRDFLKQVDGFYYDDEIHNGIICRYVKTKNDIALEQKVHIGLRSYVCYTTLSVYVNPSDTDLLKRVIMTANSINQKIDYGNFQINESTGDVIFRTYYEPDERVFMEGIDKMLGYPVMVVERYYNCLQELLSVV